MYLIWWCIAGIILSGLFIGGLSNRPKNIIVKAPKPDKPEVQKKSIWESLFGASMEEDVKAYENYVKGHEGIIKVFYYIAKYSMKKTGYSALVSAYMVKPENYYGFIFVGKFECSVDLVENRVREAVQVRFPARQMIITKLQ